MAPSPISPRNIAITGGVVLLHVAALWALSGGPRHRPPEVFVPVQIAAEVITPVQPQTQSVPTPTPAPAPRPGAQPVKRHKATPTPRAVQPRTSRAVEQRPAPSPRVAAAEQQQPASTAPPAAPPAPASGPAAAVEAPASGAKVELPSSSAEYLENPAPNYPPASRRAGEQGKVIVRVLIGIDGTAKDAELRQSSGFERLDRAALDTVRRWRYIPGKRNGVPEAMWFNVPINFVLE